MRGRALLLAAACALLARDPAAAQVRRMRAFTAVLDDWVDATPFFPRRGSWELVEVPDRWSPSAPIRRRRFTADATRAEFRAQPTPCAFGGALPRLAGRWRHEGAGRFTVRPEGSRAPGRVEWRREGGTWVIRRIVTEYSTPPRLLGRPLNEVTRDTTADEDVPAERRYTRTAGWDEAHPRVVFRNRPYIRYGLPRPLPADQLERLGSLGAVPFFVEKGFTRSSDVLYALAGPGEYQPYQVGESFCGWKEQ